ncbi:MAG TPA: TonB-dependent receptor [Acidobacteriaceae bacterium]
MRPTEQVVRRAVWLIAAMLSLASASAAEPCGPGTKDVRGTVVDGSGAPIAGAVLTTGAVTAKSGLEGEFVLPCIAEDGVIRVQSASFAQADVKADTAARVVLSPLGAHEEISVTAYRTPLAESASPASVRLVTGEELRTAAPVTLDDRLRQVTGFELFRRSSSLVANPTSQGVSLRGLGSTAASRTLLLANEIPLNDAFGGWIYWDELPELSIGGVTVVRGGASDLYGSSAIGGVVEMLPVTTARNHAELVSSEGSFHTFDEAGLLSGTVRNGGGGGWSGLATGGVVLTDGYILVAPEQRGPVDIKSNVHAQNGRVVGERDWSAGRAFVLGNVLNEARSNGTPLTTNGTRIWRYEAGVDWSPAAAQGGSLLLRAYGSAEHFRQSFSSVNATRTAETLTRFAQTPSDQLGGAVRWTQPLGARLVVLGGADTRDVRGEDNEIATITKVRTLISARQRTTGVYGEAVWTPRQWTLSAGGRIDHFQNFDAVQTLPTPAPLPQVTETVANPRLGVVRRLGSAVALTAMGFRAYRSPTENELYRNGQVGQELTLKNTSLRSERATGWETGVVLTPPGWNATLRASYFWTIVNRPITALTISTTPTSITKQRANLGQIASRGVGLEGEWQPLHWLTAVGGYQYADATVTRFDQQPSLVGSWIPQVPHQTGTLQLRGQDRRLGMLALEARVSGQQYDDDANTFRLSGFFTMNAYASHTFHKRYEAFVAAENLLDRRIEVGRTPTLTLGQKQAVRGGIRIRIGD